MVQKALLFGLVAAEKTCFKKIQPCDHIQCDPTLYDEFISTYDWNGPEDCHEKCGNYGECTHFNDYYGDGVMACALYSGCTVVNDERENPVTSPGLFQVSTECDDDEDDGMNDDCGTEIEESEPKTCFKKIRPCDHIQCDPTLYDEFISTYDWNGPEDCHEKCGNYGECTHFNDYYGDGVMACALYSGCTVVNDERENPVTSPGLFQVSTECDEDDEAEAMNDDCGTDSQPMSDMESRFFELGLTNMDRLTGYGCYCMPGATHGHNHPLDNIDLSCQQLEQCYLCARKEFGDSCTSDNESYLAAWRNPNKANGCGKFKKDGTCNRSLCECEKAFVEKMAKYEGSYDQDIKDVDREEMCARRSGGSPAESCCGDKYTFPLNQPKHGNKCCDGWKAKPAGTC